MAVLSVKLKKEFDLLYKKGRPLSGVLFSLRSLQVKVDEPTRFGIVISTKISKKAVERNNKRRQIKEIITSLKERLSKGHLILITLKDPGLTADYKALEGELLSLFKKIGAVK